VSVSSKGREGGESEFKEEGGSMSVKRREGGRVSVSSKRRE